VLGVYERSLPKVGGTYTDQIKLKEQNMYGSSRLGTKNPDLLLTSKSYTFTSYNGLLLAGTAGAQTTTTVSLTSVVHKINQKVFEMSNHLGNVLVTVSDARVPINGTGSVGSYGAIVKAGMEYSAFGVVRRTIVNNGNYRYGFNGKEMERELHNNSGDAYDFGARIYDGRVGRWLSRDHFEAKYSYYSSYSYTANNPVFYIDVNADTLRKTTIIKDLNGKVVFKKTVVYPDKEKVVRVFHCVDVCPGPNVENLVWYTTDEYDVEETTEITVKSYDVTTGTYTYNMTTTTYQEYNPEWWEMSCEGKGEKQSDGINFTGGSAVSPTKTKTTGANPPPPSINIDDLISALGTLGLGKGSLVGQVGVDGRMATIAIDVATVLKDAQELKQMREEAKKMTPQLYHCTVCNRENIPAADTLLDHTGVKPQPK
jgi:RHS repeat-associated protein